MKQIGEIWFTQTAARPRTLEKVITMDEQGRARYPATLVDAFAQCLWIRLRIYLRLGLSPDETWLCDFDDLPDMSKAPLRCTARDMLDLTFRQQAGDRTNDSTSETPA